MPQGPAARSNIDTTAHGLPPVLTPGPGSPNVIIGFMPAWRGRLSDDQLRAVTAYVYAQSHRSGPAR